MNMAGSAGCHSGGVPRLQEATPRGTLVKALSASPPTVGFLSSAVVYNTQESKAKRHDSREARSFRRRFRIPYDFLLGLLKLAKQVVFIG